MKTLKLSYRSMWPRLNPNKMPQDYFFEYVLSQKYNVVYEDKEPDVVIYSVFGPPISKSEYTNNPLIIGYSGEPHEVIGNPDLCFGFDVNNRPDYLRLPLWVLFMMWDIPQMNTPYKLAGVSGIGQGSTQHESVKEQTIEDPLNNPLLASKIMTRHKNNKFKNKFCNFTYSNPIENRIEFFKKLNEYKKVESTGSLLNNTNYRMNSKTIELSDYKFTIAFENNIPFQGYVTEKLMEPLVAGSVPIYCGGNMALTDFNEKAFINVKDFATFNDVIEYIKEVDDNEDLYNQYLSQPVFNNLVNYPKIVFDKIYNKLIEINKNLIC
jgi:hypothetical protein